MHKFLSVSIGIYSLKEFIASVISLDIHIQSEEYASCPKMATFSRCYLLGNNILLSKELLRIIDSQEFAKC